MVNLITAKQVADAIERWAPKSLAYSWDNVGLQVGSLNKEVSTVMITLDVTESVVDEAIENQADLIVAHHPLFFKPLKHFDSESRRGKVIQKLILNNITVYAAHTNLDIADGGVSDMLADKLGIKHRSVLVEDKKETLLKLAVYVPESHADRLRNALGGAGAGQIGNYSHCSFQLEGEGRFKPLSGSNPYIGTAEKEELIKEAKIEVILTEKDVSRIIDIVKEIHPYEEPAYDLIPLLNDGKTIGAGRIGELSKVLTIKELCELIKKQWEIMHVRIVGDLAQPVKRIAILGGSGQDYIAAARERGADVYITGDLTFHDSQDAWQDGMNLIDAGHYAEKVMKSGVKSYLDKVFKEQEELNFLISNENTDPFQTV